MGNGANGNGATDVKGFDMPECGGTVSIAPVVGNSRCGTIWGPDPNFVPVPGTDIAGLIFQKMTQFLGADPNRIGLVLRSQFSGCRISNQNNGLGVPLGQTFGNAPGAGGQFEIVLWGGPQLYVGSPWFFGICDTAGAPTSLDQLISWIEFFKV
jgi:hypothetical protein